MLSSVKEIAFGAKIKIESAIGQLYLDTGQDYKASVFLAGSARGGTTWVAELINYDNSYHFIFEPLNVGRVPLCKAFAWRQYLRPEDDDPKFLTPMHTILTGRLRNDWSDRYNRCRITKRRLIKEIRANLLLRWLHVHFPGMPIILLLRSPYSVITSRLRRGWNHYHLGPFLKQAQLMTDFLSPFKKELENATTPFDIHLFHWCIETFIPMSQFKAGEMHLAFYENFCLEPRFEIQRLCNFLGRRFDDRILKALVTPSSQASDRGKNLPSRDMLINGWRGYLSSEQISRINDVLRRFRLESLYDAQGIPTPDASCGGEQTSPGN